ERRQPASLAGVPPVHVLASAGDLRENLIALVRHAGGQAQSYSETAPPGPSELLLVAWPHRPVTAGGQVVWLEPEGTPTPEWREDGWHVNGLCQRGLLAALRSAGGQEESPAHVASGVIPVANKSLHVLVVEDHPINQLVLTEQLEQLGCTVSLAADGREALQRWQRGERCDVMLTDVNMPHLDGYALTRQLRVDGIRVPIIGVTANAQSDEGARCLAAGMDGYLIKPVSLAALKEVLQPMVVAGSSASSATNVMPYLERIKPAMRALFISTTRADWSAMLAAIANGDSASVNVHAHRLKGALATIGAIEAVDYCSRLEECAAEGALTNVGEHIELLKDYLCPVLEASS
ncbi:response regulator, partial [Jeongeupia chitinilytica]|uniref:response regulator n=1 Tax=Jeongeupia chitinilytica TaxID=1041641 RepID=UPI001674D340